MPPKQRFDARAISILLALAVLIGSVYANVGSHDFVDFDDYQYVLTNPGLDGRVGFDDVRRAFLEPYASNWAPIHSLSLATSDALHGPIAGAYAWTNVALHFVATAFLFLALRRLTGRTLASAWVAAIFAIHPLHVESVAWVSQRKDVLAGAFWMAAIYAHSAQREDPERTNRSAVVVLSALAMMAKATAVAIPVTLVLIDFWPLGRIRSWKQAWQTLIEKWPIAVCAAGVSAVTLFAQTESGANVSHATSFGSRLTNAALSYVTYIADSVWPVDLAYFYPYPSASTIEGPKGVASLALVLVLTALAVALWRRFPWFAMGWFWFLLTLLPMIGIVQVGGQSHADRYMYIAQIGLTLILAFGIDAALARIGQRDRARWPSRACGALAISSIVLFAVVAQRQVDTWKDSRELFGHAVEATENNYHAHRFLGVALWSAGDQVAGESHLVEALRINPDWGDARLVLATAYLQTGRFDEAEIALERSERDGADPARVWAATGALAAQRGDERRAAAAYERTLAIDPNDWEVLNNLAWIRAASSNPELRQASAALELATRAFSLRPEDPFVLGTLAGALAASGRISEAVETQTRAIRALHRSGPPSLIPDFERRLAEYRAGNKPWSNGSPSNASKLPES